MFVLRLRAAKRQVVTAFSYLLAGVSAASLVGACIDGDTPAADIDAAADAAGENDAAVSDAGATDAGTTDAGGTDAGSNDAGSTDTGSADAGGADTGASDAGNADAGGAGGVVINEIGISGVPEDWFELANLGQSDVSLEGWTFTDDPEGEPTRAAFESGLTVPAGGYLLIQFTADSPGFGLSSGGESLAITNADGAVVALETWEADVAPEGTSWGRFPNGTGAFMQLLNPTPGEANVPNDMDCGNGALDGDEACDDNNVDNGDGCAFDCTEEDGYSCAGEPSVCTTECGDGVQAGDEACDDGGTEDGDGCASDCTIESAGSPDVVVNEVVAKADPDGDPDWVELYNRGDGLADLTNWTMTDNAPEQEGHVYTFAPGTTLEAGAYLVLVEDEEGSFGYGLSSSNGDSVLLYDASGALIDDATWGEGDADLGTSWGRSPNGSGEFQTLDTVTQGSANP